MNAPPPSVAALLQSGVALTLVRQDECVFTNRAMVLATTLGSCVAAAFRHRQSGTCALFHAFWPTAPEGEPVLSPCRFADQAVAGVAERYRLAGIPLGQVEVDLAGGAFTGDPSSLHLDVGRRNVESAMGMLRSLGFSVCSMDVKGGVARTIFLDTRSGRTWIRRMKAGWENGLTLWHADVLSDGGSCRLILED